MANNQTGNACANILDDLETLLVCQSLEAQVVGFDLREGQQRYGL
jgi:hypothetical protein